MSHAKQFLAETASIAGLLDCEQIEAMVKELVDLRFRKGRLFVIGLGGSAANASHMANDLRKLCGIEAYAPTDNVAELTARANDEGWETIFSSYLQFANPIDAIFILSVGGGAKGVSLPISAAIGSADVRRMKIFGIVGRDGGLTAEHADCCIIVPTVEPSRVTPHCEAFQAVIWHMMVSHPDLQRNKTKW